VRNDFSYPTACTIRFEFTARADRPALELFWYDGGMKPRLPDELAAHNISLPREGILLVGDQGVIMAGFTGRSPRLFTKGKCEPLVLTGPSNPGGKRNAWLAAYKGEDSPGSFLNAGPITDAVNLGTVALRAGKRIEFDAAALKVTNAADANRYLSRQYRPGWEL
jgi:hypothetical protein